MTDAERWVEVWKGEDPQPPGRLLEAEGIPMRIAQAGHHQLISFGFFGLFRRQQRVQSRLLVPDAEKERARAAIKR